MADLTLATTIEGRPRVGLPTTRTINAMVEPTRGGPAPFALLQRPGLTGQFTIGSGPILRQYQKPGLFNGDLFSVSGGQLYRQQTLLGAVPYTNAPRMAAVQGQLAVVSGGQLELYDGAALTPQVFFDDGVSRLPSFSSVAVLYNIFVFPVSGSNEFFFSAVGNAGSLNAANFSQAQTSPTPIVEVAVLAEELYFFKTDAVEIWDFNGSLTAPFSESQGRTYARGCAAQGSVAQMDNALFWIGDDLSIYRSSTVPEKVSNPYMDDRVRAAAKAGGATGVSAATAFYLGIEGHSFYVLNLPTIGESYAYDAADKGWRQWGSQSRTQPDPGLFLGNCAAGQESTDLWVGSYLDGTVSLLDETSPTDNGLQKQVTITATHYMSGGVERCNVVALQCVRGVGNAEVPNPVVKMRFSDDGGRTWGSWLQSTLGIIGAYTWKAVWRYLGTMDQPGRVFEFQVAESVNFTVESVTINEARI